LAASDAQFFGKSAEVRMRLTLQVPWVFMAAMETTNLGSLITAVVGVLVLFYGRRLFWLFVGLVGFVVCFEWAPQLVPGLSPAAQWVVSLLVGVVGAVLATFVQYFLVALAGLFVGASVGADVGAFLGLTGGDWLAPVAGAGVGAILALALLDWGLIILSSVVGATVVAQALETALQVGQDLEIGIGVGLLVLGVASQAHQLGKGSRS
jgi:hypothetical protein